MNNKNCKDCYYGNICPRTEACEDFIPIIDEAEDAVIDEIIEQGREEYRTEWHQYISQYND